MKFRDNGEDPERPRNVRGRAEKQPGGGFTFVEILVAIALGAAVLSAAVVAFQAIGASRNRLGTYGSVDLGTATMTNFYGTNASTIGVWFAPNYGRIAKAEVLREQFLVDVQRAIAIYCLPRTGRSSIRPTSLPLTGSYNPATFDTRRLDTSEAFRQYLAASVPASATTFTSNAFATSGAARGQNLSIVMLVRSDSAEALTVHVVYEIDFVRSTSPGGTYASVRRYQGAAMSYYDVFYSDLPDGTAVNANDFYVAASFERAGRTTATSALLTAGRNPFYFIWWPDPAAPRLPSSGTDYRDTMRDQTSFFFAVPMFPAL